MVEIIELKENDEVFDFNEQINNNRKIICVVYMPGCMHCEMLKPIWSDVSKNVKNKYNGDALIAMLHMNAADKLEKQIPKLEGYPHITAINNGKYIDYNKPRDAENIEKFMVKYGGLTLSKGKKGKTAKVKMQSGGSYKKKTKTRKIKYRTKQFPYKMPKTKELLQVSNIHTIAFYTFGNPKGQPAVYIHGGPGHHIEFKLSKLFDLKKYYVVAIDQRGCGNSKPHGELRNNKTKDLIEDMERVRELLKIKKWIVMGGSWGSLLAVYYSQNFPQSVKGLIIRGVFLGTKKENDLVENGNMIKYIFPEEWDSYISILPVKERKDPEKAYEKRLKGKMGKKEQMRAAHHYAIYQALILKLKKDDIKRVEKEVREDKSNYTLAAFPYHYFGNNNFLPRDNYLLEKANIDKIKHIPTIIIQGQYDMITPAFKAYELHKALPNSELHMTVAGHYSFDKENVKKTIYATEKFKKLK